MASTVGNEDTINLTEHIIDQINNSISLCIRVEYDLKNAQGIIDDLYRVVPEENKLLTVSKIQNQDIIVLKCRLIARNNISFDYENISKAANY